MGAPARSETVLASKPKILVTVGDSVITHRNQHGNNRTREGEIVFRAVGVQKCGMHVERCSRTWETLSAPIEKMLRLYGMQVLRHVRGNSDTT